MANHGRWCTQRCRLDKIILAWPLTEPKWRATKTNHVALASSMFFRDRLALRDWRERRKEGETRFREKTCSGTTKSARTLCMCMCVCTSALGPWTSQLETQLESLWPKAESGYNKPSHKNDSVVSNPRNLEGYLRISLSDKLLGIATDFIWRIKLISTRRIFPFHLIPDCQAGRMRRGLLIALYVERVLFWTSSNLVDAVYKITILSLSWFSHSASLDHRVLFPPTYSPVSEWVYQPLYNPLISTTEQKKNHRNVSQALTRVHFIENFKSHYEEAEKAQCARVRSTPLVRSLRLTDCSPWLWNGCRQSSSRD